MKNLSLLFLAYFLMSCNQKKMDINETLQDTDTIPVAKVMSMDSLSVGDTLKISNTLTVEYRQKVLVFTGIDKVVLDSLYIDVLPKSKTLTSYSREEVQAALQNDLQEYMNEMKKESKSYMPEFPQTWDRHSIMEIFSDQNYYLTLRYTGYGYTGGAHGYAYEIYKTADVKEQKYVELSDILTPSQVDWNTLLLKHAGERKAEFFEPNSVSFNRNFYFNSDSITFVYGQYEIAPYSSGIIHITIPFKELSTALTPEFKKRMQIP